MKKATVAAKAAKPKADTAGSEELCLPSANREDYASNVAEQLADYEETLDGLESDMESLGWDDVAEYRNRLADLRSQIKEAQIRSDELESAEDAAWPALHESMESTLLELAEAVKGVSDVLGQVTPE
jgi:phage shock protein A